MAQIRTGRDETQAQIRETTKCIATIRKILDGSDLSDENISKTQLMLAKFLHIREHREAQVEQYDELEADTLARMTMLKDMENEQPSS